MKPFYYVYRSDESRGPKIKHATLAEALTESERLANQHPGSVFEILKCLAIVQCTQASTFWMDGEEPPEKPPYRQLENGEQTMRTDEFLTPQGIWQKSIGGYTINPVHFPHRRPL